MRLNFFLIITLLLIVNVNAQSIGIIPKERELTVYSNQEFKTDIRLSQSAGYDELITIKAKEDYSWIKLEETQFILKQGINKIVNMNIFIEENGLYIAEFEICASGVGEATLALQACTIHKLVVEAVTDPDIIVTRTAIAGSGVLFISAIGFVAYRRFRRRL